MTSQRRGVALTPMETRRDAIVRTARLAEELGYEVMALPEGWGLDSTAVLAEIALATERIRLVSGVLSVWGRTPATLAMTAATLDQISGGRYLLGLGASTRELAEGFHDTPFTHAADRLATTVTAVRTLLAGGPAPLRHDREARPLRLGLPPAPTVPIWVAALGPRTLRVAAQLADGWFPALVARDQLPALVASLRGGAGPSPRSLTVAAGPLTVADDDPPVAREIAAGCVAWYVCAMGEIYAQSLDRQGYGADVRVIRAANPHVSARSGRVPAEADHLLGQVAATGTPDEVRAQLERWDDVADVVMVGLPPGIPWRVIETTLHAAAPGPWRPRLRPPLGPTPPDQEGLRPMISMRLSGAANPAARAPAPSFRTHPVRGPFNAVFFTVLDGYVDRLLGRHKRHVFTGLPPTVVELGPGVGANLRYLQPGTRLIAVEPNRAMHGRLRARAARAGIDLELHDVPAETLDLPDASVDAVISSLVLCTVPDPVRAVSEVRRVLRPGGRFAFVEHVAAADGTPLRQLQRAVRRPWRWMFEGCSCERDLRTVVETAGFARTVIEDHRLRSPFLPFNTQIAGVATNGS